LLSLVRGYLPTGKIRSFVASQVALHLRLTRAGTIKVKTHLDRLLPDEELIHQKPAQIAGQLSDTAASILAKIMPRSFSCGNRACYRHVATFGEIILHSRVNPTTHGMMGELVPECCSGFLKDVAVGVRRDTILDGEDLRHLDRLRLPILFISGQENRMFIPESTAESYQLLSDANGASFYRRTVYPEFGHLDCYIGTGASNQIWPDLSQALDSPHSAVARPAPTGAVPAS
jgi:cholesterol oxidase